MQPLPSTARSGRSARKPQPQPLPEPEPESEAFSQEEERQSKKSSRRPPAAKPESESESDRSSDAASPSRSSSPSPSPSPSSPPPQPSKRSSRRAPHPPPPVDDAESPSSEDEAAGPAYPIVKSQPLGKSRRPRDEAEPSPLPSPKKRSERGRDRTPVSPVAQSPSPPPAVSRKGETDRTDQQQQQRERSRRRARPAAERQPEPEPSPTASSPSRSRSPSPIRDSRAERGRRAARKAASASKGEQESEKPISNVPRRDRSARRPKPPRSPSPSRSETPPIRSKASTAILAAEAKKERVHERASRSESRSPSPPVRSTKTRSKRSTRQDDSEAGTLKTEGAPLSLLSMVVPARPHADLGSFRKQTSDRPVAETGRPLHRPLPRNSTAGLRGARSAATGTVATARTVREMIPSSVATSSIHTSTFQRAGKRLCSPPNVALPSASIRLVALLVREGMTLSIRKKFSNRLDLPTRPNPRLRQPSSVTGSSRSGLCSSRRSSLLKSGPTRKRKSWRRE